MNQTSLRTSPNSRSPHAQQRRRGGVFGRFYVFSALFFAKKVPINLINITQCAEFYMLLLLNIHVHIVIKLATDRLQNFIEREIRVFAGRENRGHSQDPSAIRTVFALVSASPLLCCNFAKRHIPHRPGHTKYPYHRQVQFLQNLKPDICGYPVCRQVHHLVK